MAKSPTGFSGAWKRLIANPYQTAIANAVQRIADGKNSLGRGKNETNMFGVLISFEPQTQLARKRKRLSQRLGSN